MEWGSTHMTLDGWSCFKAKSRVVGAPKWLNKWCPNATIRSRSFTIVTEVIGVNLRQIDGKYSRWPIDWLRLAREPCMEGSLVRWVLTVFRFQCHLSLYMSPCVTCCWWIITSKSSKHPASLPMLPAMAPKHATKHPRCASKTKTMPTIVIKATQQKTIGC